MAWSTFAVSRRVRGAAGLGLLIALACLPADAGAQEVQFRWAFGAATGSGAARHFITVTDDVTLRTGDEIKMWVSPTSRCFIYVLHQDQSDEFDVMYPTQRTFDEGPAPVGSLHYIPPLPGWLQLDAATGTERVYLIASATRLTTLEQLLTRNASSPQAARAGVSRQVISELARLQKEYVAKNWSERPVTMGGQVRGETDLVHPDVARSSVEIAGAGPFFNRVFIIEHR
jgi:hypothetical protein